MFEFDENDPVEHAKTAADSLKKAYADINVIWEYLMNADSLDEFDQRVSAKEVNLTIHEAAFTHLDGDYSKLAGALKQRYASEKFQRVAGKCDSCGKDNQLLLQDASGQDKWNCMECSGAGANMKQVPAQPSKAIASKEANQYVKHRGDKWVVVQKGTGKVLSTHDTKEKAEDSFKAMMVNKHGRGTAAIKIATLEQLSNHLRTKHPDIDIEDDDDLDSLEEAHEENHAMAHGSIAGDYLDHVHYNDGQESLPVHGRKHGRGTGIKVRKQAPTPVDTRVKRPEGAVAPEDPRCTECDNPLIPGDIELSKQRWLKSDYCLNCSSDIAAGIKTPRKASKEAKNWKHTVPIGDIVGDYSSDKFEQTRDALHARFTEHLPHLNKVETSDYPAGIEELVDNLKYTDTEDEFNGHWDNIYDWADDNDVWIDSSSGPSKKSFKSDIEVECEGVPDTGQSGALCAKCGEPLNGHSKYNPRIQPYKKAAVAEDAKLPDCPFCETQGDKGTNDFEKAALDKVRCKKCKSTFSVDFPSEADGETEAGLELVSSRKVASDHFFEPYPVGAQETCPNCGSDDIGLDVDGPNCLNCGASGTDFHRCEICEQIEDTHECDDCGYGYHEGDCYDAAGKRARKNSGVADYLRGVVKEKTLVPDAYVSDETKAERAELEAYKQDPEGYLDSRAQRNKAEVEAPYRPSVPDF